MSLRLRILLVGSMVVLFVMGLLLGQHFGARPEPVAVPPETSEASATSADISALEAAERRGRQLQGQIKTLELALYAARGTQPLEPEPVAPEKTEPKPFPEGLPEQFTPASFEQIVRDVVRECGLGVDFAEVDCSEYPCIAWVRSKALSLTHAFPSRCEKWKQAFTDGATVTYHLEGAPFGGRTERYHVWVATPPKRHRHANERIINLVQKRMNARWDAMHADSSP